LITNFDDSTAILSAVDRGLPAFQDRAGTKVAFRFLSDKPQAELRTDAAA
jgi:hypothetical protein